MRYKNIFDKKVDKYGQSATLHKEVPGERCPCFDDSTGYGDPQWHRDNLDAPDCNEDGYINVVSETIDLKAFIYPSSDLDRKLVDEIVLSNIGELSKDDYIYVGKSDVDIFHLNESDYLLYDQRQWKIINPDNYKIGDTNIAFVAKLELITNG